MSKEKDISVWDLKASLKTLVQKELKSLPETLEKLEPKDRLTIFCKFLPYVFPRIETVHPSDSGNYVSGWGEELNVL